MPNFTSLTSFYHYYKPHVYQAWTTFNDVKDRYVYVLDEDGYPSISRDPQTGWAGADTMQKAINEPLVRLRAYLNSELRDAFENELLNLSPDTMAGDEAEVAVYFRATYWQIVETLELLGGIVDFNTRSDTPGAVYITNFLTLIQEEMANWPDYLADITATFAELPDLEAYFALLDSKIDHTKLPESIDQLASTDRVLMLPVKLSTHFYEKGDKQLLVRVLPDTLSLVNHFPYLSRTEYELGKSFWRQALQLALVAQNKSFFTENGLVSDLMSKVGSGRAAFVLINTTPIGWEQYLTELFALSIPQNEGLRQEVVDNYELETKFPEPELRDREQNIKSLVKLLPTNFQLYVFDSDTNYKYHIVGPAIPENLWIGLEDNPDESLTDPASPLTYSEESAWVVNFEAAVSVGMGFRVTIDEQDWNTGFKKLIVTGIRLGNTSTDASSELSSLLESHYYTSEADIVPPATPTNLIDSLGQTDQLQDVRRYSPAMLFRRVVFPSSWQSPSDIADGNVLASALGIDPAVTSKLLHAERTDQEDVKQVNQSIFEATLGTYVRRTLEPFVSNTNSTHRNFIQGLKDFWSDHVNGRGKVPSIRIGNQPYSVALVTRTLDLAFDNTDQYHLARYYKLFDWLHGLWQTLLDENAKAHVGAMGEANPLEVFWKVLSQLPESVEFRAEYTAQDPPLTTWQGQTKDFLKQLEDKLLGPDPSIDFPNLSGEEITDLLALVQILLSNPQDLPNLNDRWLDFSQQRNFSAVASDLNLSNGSIPLNFYGNRFFLHNLGFDASEPSLSLGLIHRIEEFRKYLTQSIETALFAGKIIDQNVPDDSAHIQYRINDASLSPNFNYILSILEVDNFQDHLDEVLKNDQRLDVSTKPRALLYLLLFGTYFEEILAEANHWVTDPALTAALVPTLIAPTDLPNVETGVLYTINPDLQNALNAQVDPALLSHLEVPVGITTVIEVIFWIIGQDIAETPFWWKKLQDPNGNLKKFRFALQHLASVPRARLEHCLVQALDCLTYRLDPWLTGMTHYQLQKCQSLGSRVFIGSYGILFDLKPRSQATLDKKDKYVVDTEALGYVVAPSVSQAITSGILLQAHESTRAINVEPGQAGGDLPLKAILDINLSSLRARVAMGALRGRLSGQAVREYLGVLFEQVLAQNISDPNLLLDTTNTFRRKFAYDVSLRKLLQDAGYSEPKLNKMAEQMVTDGFALFGWVKNKPAYPFELEGLDNSVEQVVIAAVQQVFLAFDAMADLETAEKLHSFIYRGVENIDSPSNHDYRGRSSNFLQTRHAGKTIQHSLMVLGGSVLPSNWGVNGTIPNGTSSLVSKPMGRILQVGLERILEQLLTAPTNITWRYTLQMPGNPQEVETTLSQYDFGLVGLFSIYEQDPADFKRAFAEMFHLLVAKHKAKELQDRTTPAILIDYDFRFAGESLSLQLLEDAFVEVSAILGKSRSLSKVDLVPHLIEDTMISAEAKSLLSISLNDAQTLLLRLRSAMSLNANSTSAAYVEFINATRVLMQTKFWPKLSAAWDNFFFTKQADSTLTSYAGLTPAQMLTYSLLFDTSQSLLVETAALLLPLVVTLTDPILNFSKLPSSWSYQDIQDIQTWLTECSGTQFRTPILIQDPLRPENIAIQTLFAQEADLGSNDEKAVKLADWIYGLSRVNGNTNYLRQHFLDLELEQVSDPFAKRLSVFQDQTTGLDNRWVGYELEEGDSIIDGTRSFALLNAEAITNGDSVLGIILDDWTEIVPEDEQVAGIALNHNQPDSEAPNALILAIQPTLKDNWTETSLLDFVQETLNLTSLRAVDTDMIKREPGLSVLLPAITNDYAPSGVQRNPAHPRELDYTWVNRNR